MDNLAMIERPAEILSNAWEQVDAAARREQREFWPWTCSRLSTSSPGTTFEMGVVFNFYIVAVYDNDDGKDDDDLEWREGC